MGVISVKNKILFERSEFILFRIWYLFRTGIKNTTLIFFVLFASRQKGHFTDYQSITALLFLDKKKQNSRLISFLNATPISKT